jgi:hypothetical protein
MTTDVHQVGQKGPGLPTVVLALASVREGGANIVSTAMQSWGGTASQMPMTASHVSSLSLSGDSLMSDNSHWCGCHS